MDKPTEVEVAIYHLLHVWRQYNSWGSDSKAFSHANMGAGEAAADYLERMGYGHDNGYQFVPNQKAIDLMGREDIE